MAVLYLDRSGEFITDDRGLFVIAVVVAFIFAFWAWLGSGDQPEDEQPEQHAPTTTHIQPIEISTTSRPILADNDEEYRKKERGLQIQATFYLLSQLVALAAVLVTVLIMGLRAETILVGTLSAVFIMMPYAWWESRQLKRSFSQRGLRAELRVVTIGKYLVLVCVLLFLAYYAALAFELDVGF